MRASLQNSDSAKVNRKEIEAEGKQELESLANQSPEQLSTTAKAFFSQSLGPLSLDEVSKKAQKLLDKDSGSIPIPEEVYAEAKTVLGFGSHARHVIRENYLKRRKFLLETLRDKKKIYYSSDADGTCTFKTVQKVENTRSIGSLVDKHYLRILLKAFQKIGAYFEINTARTGFVPGPSAVGTEGPRFRDANGDWQNPRSPNEISSLLHEFGIHSLDDPESRDLFKTLVINGLSGGVKHDPSGKLQINEATIKYGRFIDKLNQISLPGAEKGFLSRLEEIVSNTKEKKPLKVLEYKSIPRILIDHPEFKVEDYLKFIDLVEKSRAEKISSTEFFIRLNSSGIKLPKQYYDPANPPATEENLSTRVREGMLACLTPHAFDSDNRIRDDLKIQFYENLSRFARSEEAQEWAEKTFGIPKGTGLFTINKKDVSDIDFSPKAFRARFKNLNDFRTYLKDKCKEPKNKNHTLIDVIENPQPYCEIAPNTSKAEVLPAKTRVDTENLAVVAAGDSPGSDAPMLAQAILLGGSGFIVRGLMTEQDVASSMVELLSKDSNQWHEDAMTDAGKDQNKNPLYKLNRTGEIRTKSEWAKELLPKVEDKIYKCSNIHENNAFNASIFAEFFENNPEFSLKLDETKPWVKEVLQATNQRSLVTPVNESNERALESQVYSKSLLEKYPFLNNLPDFIKDHIKIEAAGPLFKNLLGLVSSVMMVAAPFELLGEFTGSKVLSNLARYAQKWSYRINTVASGVSRGLVLSAHQFSWQFVGECFGCVSTFMSDDSKFGKILRALSNTVLIGRSNELAMRTNYNLDEFAKDKVTQEAIKEQYEGSEEFKDKRVHFDNLTKMRMDRVDYLEHQFLGGVLGRVPFAGRLMASALADSWQALGMGIDFIRHRALNKHTLPNFFTLEQVGPTKLSKNSGKPYGEVHEEHTYAFAGLSTLGVSVLSIIAMATKNQFFSSVLTSLANMIPALGIVTAGKLVYQDQSGDPRLFTDINKSQQRYSPEQSGLLQMFGGWGQALTGLFINTSWGPALYDFATGLYLRGIREQLKGGIDDAAVNQLTRQGKYYKLNGTTPKPAAPLVNPGAILAKPMPKALAA